MLHRYVCIDEITDENYMEDSAPEESIFRVSSNTAGWGYATFRHFLHYRYKLNLSEGAILPIKGLHHSDHLAMPQPLHL